MPTIPLSALREDFPHAVTALEALSAEGLTPDAFADAIDNTPAAPMALEDLMRKVGQALAIKRKPARARAIKDVEDALVVMLVSLERQLGNTATRMQFRPVAKRMLARPGRHG